MKIPSILIIGDMSQAGTYVLRIRLKEDTALKFGKFKKGKLISLPAGDYTYVGSALSEKGATSLARRLVRHATRSGDKPPHAIREAMIHRFVDCGLGPRDLLPSHGKKLFWNIDFLLDLQLVEIIIFRCENLAFQGGDETPPFCIRLMCSIAKRAYFT